MGIMPGRFGQLHGSGVRVTEEYLERSYIDPVWPELCERRMFVAFSARLLNSDGLSLAAILKGARQSWSLSLPPASNAGGSGHDYTPFLIDDADSTILAVAQLLFIAPVNLEGPPCLMTGAESENAPKSRLRPRLNMSGRWRFWLCCKRHRLGPMKRRGFRT